MPKKALVFRSGVWIEKEATSCDIIDLKCLAQCCTPGCKAEMTLISASQTKAAYFRSKDKKKHISVNCVKNSIIFNPSDYNEDKFDLDFAFNSMMKRNAGVGMGTKGTRTGSVGGGKDLRLHTLPMIYAMCISKKKDDYYNTTKIDDIFADTENFSRYEHGINGSKIVETSFYHPYFKEKAIRLNFPINNTGIESWVRIVFEEKELFEKIYAKLKNSLHIEPIIVAGNWNVVEGNSEYQNECIITSEKQIHFPKIN